MLKQYKGFLWNMAGCVSFAATSLILVLIVSRYLGIETTGVFGMSLTTAQLLYAIGLFGVNLYQRTDYSNKYIFNQYFRAKIFTSILMIIVLLLTLLASHPSRERMIYTVLLTTFFCTNSFAEVYQSFYVKIQRLDLSGKSLSYRMIFSNLVFFFCISYSKNLILALLMLNITNLGLFPFTTSFSFKRLHEKESSELSINFGALNIVKDCTFICISAFLNLFIFNMSKYAIEQFYDAEMQGYYNIIFIPVLAVNLLCEFLFIPMLKQFSNLFYRDKPAFKTLLKRSMLLILSVDLLCIIFMRLVGIDILGWIYKVNLDHFRTQIYILLFAGFFVASNILLFNILVIMRKQRVLCYIYIVSSFLSIIISYLSVYCWGINGGAFSVAVTEFILLIAFIWGLNRYTEEGSMKHDESNGSNNDI